MTEEKKINLASWRCQGCDGRTHDFPQKSNDGKRELCKWCKARDNEKYSSK